MLVAPCQGTQGAPGKAMSPPAPPTLFWGVTPTCRALGAGWLRLLVLLVLPQHRPGVGHPGLVGKLEGDRGHQHPGDTASPLAALQSPALLTWKALGLPGRGSSCTSSSSSLSDSKRKYSPECSTAGGPQGVTAQPGPRQGCHTPGWPCCHLPGLCLAPRTPIKANHSMSPKRRPSGTSVQR